MIDRKKIKTFPALPGVYLMKDDTGEVLYVGKAGNLRSRVGNYFRPAGDNRPRIPYLMARVVDIECLVTDTEKEALILENNLIKKYRPRYNVYFRDDKTYSSIRIDLSQPYPRPVLVRRVRGDGALYFGPYAAGRSLKSTLRFLQKLFPYRICSDNLFHSRSRPCLYHQIGRCPAPCVGKISPAQYRGIIDGLVLFLRGRKKELLTALRRRLRQESDELRYEEAARTRDRVRAIEETLERQKTSRVDSRDRDAVALVSGDGGSVFQLISIRSGRMLDGRTVFFDREFPDPAEALSSFLSQLYGGSLPLPDEIILPFLPASASALREIFRERKGSPVALAVPRRGMKLDWLRLAEKNAALALRARPAGAGEGEVLEKLREKLNLRRRPKLIECFDISNLGGKEAVGAMAVFREGEKYGAGFRRWRIRGKESPDDCAMLAEVLGRRLRRAREEGVWPDLIIVDGGKGQLNAARAVFRELAVDYPDLVALAEENRSPSGRPVPDRVFLPGRKNPAALRPGSPELRLLMRIRDEAHRFAVSYHRKVREKETFRSPLDGIPGIGPIRKRRLLECFGGEDKIRVAGLEELMSVPGISREMAEKIRSNL